MFAASIVLAGGGHDKILMVWSPFVHLSRLFIAGIVKCFVRSHFPPSHVPAGSSLINLLSIHPTTPSLYKKFTFSTALCGSIDTHILFVCVCVYTHTVCSFLYAGLGKCHGFADSGLECTLTVFIQHSQNIYSICKWFDII